MSEDISQYIDSSLKFRKSSQTVETTLPADLLAYHNLDAANTAYATFGLTPVDQTQLKAHLKFGCEQPRPPHARSISFKESGSAQLRFPRVLLDEQSLTERLVDADEGTTVVFESTDPGSLSVQTVPPLRGERITPKTFDLIGEPIRLQSGLSPVPDGPEGERQGYHLRLPDAIGRLYGWENPGASLTHAFYQLAIYKSNTRLRCGLVLDFGSPALDPDDRHVFQFTHRRPAPMNDRQSPVYRIGFPRFFAHSLDLIERPLRLTPLEGRILIEAPPLD